MTTYIIENRVAGPTGGVDLIAASPHPAGGLGVTDQVKHAAVFGSRKTALRFLANRGEFEGTRGGPRHYGFFVEESSAWL